MTVGLVEGAAESAGDLAGVGELDGPLGDRPDELGQIGHGLVHLADIVVGGGDDHGCAGVEGVEHEGDAVGEPAVDVEADEGGATGSTGVGLGHAHGDAFLEGQEVANLRVVAKQVDDGRLAGARVAKDVLDALGLEHFKQRLLAGHRFSHGGLQWGSARKDAGRAAGRGRGGLGSAPTGSTSSPADGRRVAPSVAAHPSRRRHHRFPRRTGKGTPLPRPSGFPCLRGNDAWRGSGTLPHPNLPPEGEGIGAIYLCKPPRKGNLRAVKRHTQDVLDSSDSTDLEV